MPRSSEFLHLKKKNNNFSQIPPETKGKREKSQTYSKRPVLHSYQSQTNIRRKKFVHH